MKLNLKELREIKNFKTVSSKEALKDVSRINWSKDVLEGKKKIVIK